MIKTNSKIKAGPFGSVERWHDFILVIPLNGPAFLFEDIMETKICSTCKEEKPLKEFHKNKTRKDGMVYQCKDCVKLHEQSKAIKEYRLKYFTSEKGMAVRRKYSKSESGRTAAIRATRKYSQKNPLKRKAYNYLNGAVRFRKIKRQPCEICGSATRIHGHHEDYSKPLDVIWLCHQHHVELHRGVEA